jgi:5'-nucleotidase (lipoprotein e(P4) family)
MTHVRIAALFIAAMLAACHHQQRPDIYAGASSSAQISANDQFDAVLWSQTAIEHDLVYREIYQTAQTKLLEALKDPSWDALPRGERSNDTRALTPAVIVDVDETVLDNSPFAARMIRDNGTFNDIAWRAWVEQKGARPLPGALEFAKFAQAHGVTVFYLTNRDETLTEATRDNLRTQGFPLAPSEETVLGKGAQTPGCSAAKSDKGCRRRLIAQSHRVLLMCGDQLGDFIDGTETGSAARADLAKPYLDWFGQRWFVLPNATYGAWEAASVGPLADPKQHIDPRKAKHAALREN